jgi:opacity protein-like surface antigen
MKSYLKYSLLGLALTSGASIAANPMNGIYGGLIVGGSYSPKTNIIFNAPLTPTGSTCSSGANCSAAFGKLSYSGFGNIGGQIGVRMNQFRVELEPIVNYNPYQKITVGTTKYNSPKSSAGLRLKGDTTTAALMVNGFYDFFTPNGSNFAPYLGAGVGYAYVDNSLRFYCNNQTIACTKYSKSQSSAAVQGILGAAYFMDDFTWFGLDYRYITTQKINVLDSRLQIHTINLSFSGMFYCDL